MNKKIIAGIAVILLAAAAIVAGLLFFNKKPQQTEVIVENKNIQEEVKQDKGYRAQLDYAEGQVEKRLSSENGWIAAERGDVFMNGVEVRTLVNSKAVLTFEDGSIARLDQNTQVKIVTEENSIKLEMPSGIIFNKVSKKASRQYIVDSGSYSMKALGTTFSVLNEKGNAPELLVLESQVEVKKSGENLGETATAGEKIAIANDKIEKKKIEKTDLEKEFVAWSIKEDKIDFKLEEEKKKETSMETKEETGAKIILSGKKSDEGIRLTWQTENPGSFDGFKLVKSKSVNPVYPGDDYQYFTGSETKAYTWKLTDGNKYHFRVCKYVGGKCLLYSNDVYVEAPEGSKEEDDDYATSISLNAKKDGNAADLSWSISGGSAPLGFKIVKSKDKNPVYPGNDYHYLSDKNVRSYEWDGFKSGSSYHFRVCIYKGGSCGAYSNDVEIDF